MNGTISRGISILLMSLTLSGLSAQNKTFTKQDTLRGSVTPERSWWDLLRYDLSVEVFPEKKRIEGVSIIEYKVVAPQQRMQIDLQPPLRVKKVTQGGRKLNHTREGNVIYITFNKLQAVGDTGRVAVHYGGKPVEAKRPPWDGGFTWSKDDQGVPFIATSCQGLGSSVWWPCKDHMYDEPDLGMDIRVTVPNDLVAVANGRLKYVSQKANRSTYHWKVINPINNYGVNINIGNYAYFSEVFPGEKGALDCDYYVLKQNLKRAKKQFKDVGRMLKAFEYWFGPYPFYEDSFKLVEVPYLGMEHQSSVTYGNDYQNGYKGSDLSGSGWGMKFDFIIIHESGHEWFANNITYKDIADMWIHESFTAYSENLFLDYHYGKKASSEYVTGTRKNIANDMPIIGTYGVNRKGSKDMYYKGSNMLHTLRQLVDDDELWRQILRGLNRTFYHKTVTSNEIESYIMAMSGIDLRSFFDQYLRDARVPKFEYEVSGTTLKYRWVHCIDSFDMSLLVFIEGKPVWMHPTTQWKTREIPSGSKRIEVDHNFYIKT